MKTQQVFLSHRPKLSVERQLIETGKEIDYLDDPRFSNL